MVGILLVHGRSRPLFGPVEMKEQWLVALRSGFDAAGLDVPFADEDVRLPWYGGNLTHLVVLGRVLGGRNATIESLPLFMSGWSTGRDTAVPPKKSFRDWFASDEAKQLLNDARKEANQ